MKRTKASPGTPSKQARIESFFASPSARQPKSEPAEPDSPCPPSPSERRLLEQEAADEELARQLQREWDSERSEHTATTLAHVKQELELQAKNEQVLQPSRSAAVKDSDERLPSTSSAIASTMDLDRLDADISSIELGTDVFAFDPGQVDIRQWPTRPSAQEGKTHTAPYALLAHTFSLVSATRSRLAIVTILTNMLRVLMRHDSEALLPAIYLVSNHIAPTYDGIELGLGGSLVTRAIRDVTGKSNTHLRSLWNKTGDPGDVAFEAKRDVKTLAGPRRPIEVVKLFSTLHQIAAISGTGSSAAKLSHITKLLVACRGEETRFLVRTLHSHLRINAVKTTITSAIARAFSLDGPGHVEELMVAAAERRGLLANPSKPKDRSEPRRLHLMDKLARCERLVREVRARHPNFSSIVPALLEGGLGQLSVRVPLRVGTPLSPMLGSITRSLPSMHTKLGPRAFVSEFKYDGQRVQVHAIHLPRDQEGDTALKRALVGGKGTWVGPESDIYVRLFSRHLEDMTDKYPDICGLMPLLMKDGTVTSLIIDAEVVALSLQGALLPFQTLANRSRKNVELSQVKVRVGVFAFDLMYLNGRSLLKTAFRKRRSLLHRMMPTLTPEDIRIARFSHVQSLESNEPEDVEEFFRLARTSKCEG